MRLLPHSFIAVKDGQRRTVVFYARTRVTARKMADQWSARRGWRVIR
jgi:hypothetical protein